MGASRPRARRWRWRWSRTTRARPTTQRTPATARTTSSAARSTSGRIRCCACTRSSSRARPSRLRLPRLAGYTLRWVCFATPVEQPSEEQPQQEQPGLVPAVALDWAEPGRS
nr:hypothetical protein [Angustibacter aerolatus]